MVFDSSTLFKLPDGADRGPEAAWVLRSRWDTLTPDEQETFPPLCPDFVVELVSQSDSMPQQRSKMTAYLQNGARLGWLLDPYKRQAEIYRPGQLPEVRSGPTTLPGEDVLLGLELDLTDIL